MPRKPEGALTQDERKLLIVAAKLFAAMQEHAVRPPQTEEDKVFWDIKLQEELVRPQFTLIVHSG
jgi:hypothetical protein